MQRYKEDFLIEISVCGRRRNKLKRAVVASYPRRLDRADAGLAERDTRHVGGQLVKKYNGESAVCPRTQMNAGETS